MSNKIIFALWSQNSKKDSVSKHNRSDSNVWLTAEQRSCHHRKQTTLQMGVQKKRCLISSVPLSFCLGLTSLHVSLVGRTKQERMWRNLRCTECTVHALGGSTHHCSERQQTLILRIESYLYRSRSGDLQVCGQVICCPSHQAGSRLTSVSRGCSDWARHATGRLRWLWTRLPLALLSPCWPALCRTNRVDFRYGKLDIVTLHYIVQCVPCTDSSFHRSLLLPMTPDRWTFRTGRSMAVREKSICPSSLFPWRLLLCLCTDSTVTEPLPVRLKQSGVRLRTQSY